MQAPEGIPSDIREVDARQLRWPLHDAAASRALEAAAALTLPPHALMARAGLSTARLAMALWPHARRVQVWAGPGNNGGDGLVAARQLQQAGRDVRVALLGDPERLPPDASWALAQAQAAGVHVAFALPEASEPVDLHIDALLGLGASRAPSGLIAAAITAMQADRSECGTPVLAVDLPSGLHADTGTAMGEIAVVADATLALLSIKPGCCTASGRDHVGRLWFDDLGVQAGEPSAWLQYAGQRSLRVFNSNKGRFGDVVVVGGAPGMTGAAWLAARAALAAGAGRVTASPLGPQSALFDPWRPELMGREAFWTADPAALAAATVVCGCGGGQAVKTALPALLAHTLRLVLDADALNAMAADLPLRHALCARAAAGRQTVITPHPLEAARLLGVSSAEVQGDRLKAAHDLAKQLQVTAVLKGSGTVVAAPSEVPRICATGNAALSTAGTGDVLAGWLGGLWAQTPTIELIDVAAAAVAWHGAAADDWLSQGHRGPLLASDLVERLARG